MLVLLRKVVVCAHFSDLKRPWLIRVLIDDVGRDAILLHRIVDIDALSTSLQKFEALITDLCKVSHLLSSSSQVY